MLKVFGMLVVLLSLAKLSEMIFVCEEDTDLVVSFTDGDLYVAGLSDGRIVGFVGEDEVFAERLFIKSKNHIIKRSKSAYYELKGIKEYV